MLQPGRRQKPIRIPRTAARGIDLTWSSPVNAILNVLHQRTGATSEYCLGAPVVVGVDVDDSGFGVPVVAGVDVDYSGFGALVVAGVDVDHLGTLLDPYQAITDEINELKKEVAQLKSAIEPEPPQIREISDAKAKSEVRAFFNEHDGEVIYPDDVAEVLNIDLMQAVRVCDALAKEGKIAQTTRGSS